MKGLFVQVVNPLLDHHISMTINSIIFSLIKTPCGRSKFAELAARQGILARLRLAWFVLMASLRDWHLPDPDR